MSMYQIRSLATMLHGWPHTQGAHDILAHRAPIPEEEPMPGEEPIPDEEPAPHPDPVVVEPTDQDCAIAHQHGKLQVYQ